MNVSNPSSGARPSATAWASAASSTVSRRNSSSLALVFGPDCAIACAAMPAAEPLMATKPVALAPLPTVPPALMLAGTRPEAATPPPRILPTI